jgi:ABC-type transport system involved in cytochrome c biogenesis permease component
MEVIFFLFFFTFVIALYFFPSIIALIRKKHNLAAIMVLNLLLGLTGIGWVIALVWALIKEEKDGDQVKAKKAKK